MPSEADVPPDAVVIRFRPMERERCLKRLDQDYRATGQYCLSIFADVRREGENDADLRARLVAASEIQGMSPKSNKVYYRCTSAQKLYDRKFTFWKDSDGSDEVAEHYSVDFGPLRPTLEDVDRFIDAFEPEPEKRPS